MRHIDIVFDGPPSHESGRFVEVENDAARASAWANGYSDLMAIGACGSRRLTARTISRPRNPASQQGKTMSTSSTAASSGIGLGSAIAVVLSNEHNHSILWMILHGICSWFYVIYAAIAH